MKRIGVCVVLCMLLAACGGAPSSQTIFYSIFEIPTEGNNLAFYSLSDPQAEPTQLLKGSAADFAYVRFSPDGKTLVLLTAAELKNEDPTKMVPVFEYTLQSVMPDGQNPVIWAKMKARPGFFPVFFITRDSQRLVYMVCLDDICSKAELYVGDLASGNKTLKASGDYLVLGGITQDSKIFYSSVDMDTRQQKYYLIDPVGEAVEIAGLEDVTTRAAVFTNKNQVLMIDRDLKDSTSRLLVGNADFSDLKPLSAAGDQVVDFVISPDGSQALIYGMTEECMSRYGLQMVDLGSDTGKSLGCAYTGTMAEFSPDSKEVIWMDEKVTITRSSINGEVLEKFPVRTGQARYLGDGSQIIYWFRDEETHQACIYLRARAGGEAQKLEKTCISTADNAALPGMLLPYASWRMPENTR